jgi:hypothetical protein
MSTLSTTNLKNPSSGSNNIVLATDGSATIATLSSTTITGTTIQGTIKSGTAVASTSGTSIDFTSIPSWVKRITVMFQGVSTSGTSIVQVQLGTSGGIETSGYTGSTSAVAASTVASVANSAGVQVYGAAFSAASSISGLINFSLFSSATNTWVYGGGCGFSNTTATGNAQGNKSLSGTLDRVRITTVNGTDTFDAGTINILYEG